MAIHMLINSQLTPTQTLKMLQASDLSVPACRHYLSVMLDQEYTK